MKIDVNYIRTSELYRSSSIAADWAESWIAMLQDGELSPSGIESRATGYHNGRYVTGTEKDLAQTFLESRRDQPMNGRQLFIQIDRRRPTKTVGVHDGLFYIRQALKSFKSTMEADTYAADLGKALQEAGATVSFHVYE